MISNVYLLVFALSFMGCVLATPLVTRLAARLGAIDRPDQFRRIHKGAVPRMGGLGVAVGLGLGILPILVGTYLRDWWDFSSWWSRQWAVVVAGLIILIVGVIDDTVELRPRTKLGGQALAVLVLFLGGIRIDGVSILGIPIQLSYPISYSIAGWGLTLDIPSFLVTMLWFLGCMNVWNLIDGMDGLASGIGILVSGTLMLVAIHQGNDGSAAMAAALAGSLAGFLLYNWHPAVIFLGDSGSLLIGLLIGVIGVQDSLKGTTTVAILFPLLAMGLPISDTMMAIFRRWVRNLPLSSGDRRHVHHLVQGLGLSPRQSALLLYTLTGFLCGVVLLGVGFNNEPLAVFLGLTGCVGFLLILMSRRDELATLWADFRARSGRKKQERLAAKETWEAIQKIELCDSPEKIWETLLATAQRMGSDSLKLTCARDGHPVVHFESDDAAVEAADLELSGPMASFRFPSGHDLQLSVSLHLADKRAFEADIAFRSLQRLSLAVTQRFERLLDREEPFEIDQSDGDVSEHDGVAAFPHESASPSIPAMSLSQAVTNKGSLGWLRGALGWGSPMARQTRFGDD